MAAGAQRRLSGRSPLARSPRRAPRSPLTDGLARLRAQLARVPAAAKACALVAVLNALAWGLVVPAFQVPDEPAHYAYAEYLVQHGRPPAAAPADRHSSSEEAAMRGVKFQQLQLAAEDGAIWTAPEQARMRALLAAGGSRADGNGAGKEVGGEPPLYYALQAVPYTLAGGGTVLDRLALMRVLAALLGGVTVLFTFLFLREALPAVPEAWTVGALGVAFTPMFAFMSSGVNSDNLLYAASAALFYLLARGFRRGLSPRLAVAIGAALAAALMTKFNAFGLVPGAAVALVALGARRERAWRPRALALPALALGVAVAPILLEMALNATVWRRPVVGASAGNFRTSALHPQLGDGLAYLWQFYLVRLPGTATHSLSSFALRHLWIDGFVGSFGWVETYFRPIVYDLALVPLAALALLVARTLLARRSRLRARAGELLAYATLALGTMAFVGVASYISYLRSGDSIAQIRYLFPLLPLYGTLLALASRAGGRRWAPVLGVAIVVLAIGHDVFSQLLVVSRYYA
ncbi:MAG TPA: DUF2142 domain-containing protein [Conexibacter sp.]|nr:DUF2142 domain-containing protein [Conexibacter sp.]